MSATLKLELKLPCCGHPLYVQAKASDIELAKSTKWVGNTAALIRYRLDDLIKAHKCGADAPKEHRL